MKQSSDIRKLKVRIGDPAGNTTVLVTEGKVAPGEYAEAARQLMAVPEWKGEQVGFVTRSLMGGAGRLEMMGGEFCGNAARTFALMTAEQKGIRQGTVPVEISGCGKVLLARVDRDRGEASVEMPLPRETDWLEWRGYGRFPLVRMEGICHVIVQGKTLSREEVRELAEETVRREETEAAGVLFLDENRMRPAVYVKETDSLVYESSCGSGSVAAAVWLSQGQPDGIWNCELKQPGGVITVSVTRKDGRVTACSIGGPVRLGEEQETEIVLSGQPEIG